MKKYASKTVERLMMERDGGAGRRGCGGVLNAVMNF